MSTAITNLYRFEEFELHAARRSFTRSGEKISLAPKTFDVLLYLVSNSGRVIPKQDLLAAVWPESFVEESNLTQHIFALRKALTDRSGCIATLPGRGYQFTAVVETIPDLPPAAAMPAAPPTSAAAPARPAIWAYSVILVVLCGLLGWGMRQHINGAIPGDHHEVVLADFDNSTGDPDLDHSLKTLLAIDLAQSPYLIVASDSEARKVLKLMSRPADSELTTPVAREVCERLNDQVVLSGLIARFGQKYLVTLTAADCSNGKDLVHTKSVAPNRDGIIAAVDSAAADMRRRLGEPLATLHRPGQPLLLAHTFSLEALQAYTQARALHVQLKYADAIPSYKRAIELDPNFVDAWAQLANCYNNLGESQLGDDAMARAYALRDQADEPARLRITAMHEYWHTGDRHAAIRAFQNWATLYPNQVNAWVLLGQFQGAVGRTDLAIDALRHAAALRPDSADPVSSLAIEQLYAGRLDDARTTCRNALNRGLDNLPFHRTLLEIAFLQHDALALEHQLAWFREKADPDDRDAATADLDMAAGKVHAAVALYLHLSDQHTSRGYTEGALENFVAVPGMEFDAGLTADARRHFQRYIPVTHLIGPSFMQVILTAARLGQLDTARGYLQYMVANGPQDTDVHELYAPMGQASIDLAGGNPTQALARLPSATPWELTDLEVPALRARIYLAAHQPEAAAHEFQTIIDHPFTDPLSPAIPLAHLGLARTLTAQDNPAAAALEYETLFQLWKDADPDLPILQQAHLEFVRLNKSH